MNLDQFFHYWRITENPFRGEEARHDAVFARMMGLGGAAPVGDGVADPGRSSPATHSDFAKILGSLEHLSTAVVFGEKGSGKTAIRLQITEHVESHNRASPDRKIFLIPYDDLNAFLDRLHERVGTKDPADSLARIRLVDHVDAMLSIAVGRLCGLILGEGNALADAEARRLARRMPRDVRRDLVLLHAVYADGLEAAERTARLRRALRLARPRRDYVTLALTAVGWIPAALVLWAGGFLGDAQPNPDFEPFLRWVIFALGMLWILPAVKWSAWDRLAARRIGRRLRRQIRISDRTDNSYGEALRVLARGDWPVGRLPLTDTDEPRYEMLARLTRVVRALGYVGVMVLVDRIDEPTLVSGDPGRMKSVIWPMLNNKFLQQEGFALKMLLPIELRYELFRESSAFFQEARLDKQNLVERLSWTGSTLYDLCEARLNACREDGAEPMSLLAMFETDVVGKDLVDALDQMHQPRDAFKFLYQCIAEHCSNVTAEEEQWRVPRLVLEIVRKQQSERVQALYRGIRPA